MKTMVSFRPYSPILFAQLALVSVLVNLLEAFRLISNGEKDKVVGFLFFSIPLVFLLFALLNIPWSKWRTGELFEIATDENGLEFRAWKQRKSLAWNEIARAQKRQFLRDGEVHTEILLWDKDGEKQLSWLYPASVAEPQKSELAALETQISERCGLAFERIELPFFGNGAANPEAIARKKWSYFRVWMFLGFLCMALGFVMTLLLIFVFRQGEKSWPFWILFLLGIIPMLFDSRREISEHGISEKCPIDEKEIAWHEVQKIRIEGAINALVFVSKSKQIRVSWPPKSDAEALLHFLELKRQENGFAVERLDA